MDDAVEQSSQHRYYFSVKLWPPSQNTRHMLVERMISNLTSKSIFTHMFGTLKRKEAIENARGIEVAAFATARLYYEEKPDGDGSSAIRLYAKQCSKLLLEVLKRVPCEKSNKESIFDISKGDRSFIEANEARELLRPLMEPGNSFTKMCFSNRSFGLEAAQVAHPILTSLKDQLREVDLSDFVAGRPEAEAIDVSDEGIR